MLRLMRAEYHRIQTKRDQAWTNVRLHETLHRKVRLRSLNDQMTAMEIEAAQHSIVLSDYTTPTTNPESNTPHGI